MRRDDDSKGQESVGIRLQPILHVASLEPALRFFEALGGTLGFGSRDGDWALVKFGATELGVLAHPPNPEQGNEALELGFISDVRLETVEARAAQAGVTVIQRPTDEAFGRQMILRLPDGPLVKINEIERALVE